MNKRIKLLILLLISSLNFNLILKPLKLVTGGTQGLALIINNFIRINPSIIILIINIIMLILSFIFLEKETIKGTLISVFIYPLFVKLTSYLIIPLDNSLILIILAGLISGITGGYILKLGYSTGGINILVVILHYSLSPLKKIDIIIYEFHKSF